MLRVTIDDQGTIKKTIAATRALKTQFRDRSAPLKRMRTYHKTRWIANINSEGGTYGAFAPLAPETVRKRRGSAHPILRWDGKLLRWVGTAAQAGEVSRETLTWDFSWSGGRDGSYAVLHSEGYEHTPARVVFDTNGDDEEHDVELIEEWVDRLLAKYYS